jgi:hypothetical protein
MNEMSRACGVHVGYEKCIKTLVEKLEGKRPLGRHRSRWEGDIKI